MHQDFFWVEYVTFRIITIPEDMLRLIDGSWFVCLSTWLLVEETTLKSLESWAHRVGVVDSGLFAWGMFVSGCSESSLDFPSNKFSLDEDLPVSGQTSVELELSTDVGLSNGSFTVVSFSTIGSASLFVGWHLSAAWLLVEHNFLLSSVTTLLRGTFLEYAGGTCTELGLMGFISDSFCETDGGNVPLWTAL